MSAIKHFQVLVAITHQLSGIKGCQICCDHVTNVQVFRIRIGRGKFSSKFLSALPEIEDLKIFCLLPDIAHMCSSLFLER